MPEISENWVNLCTTDVRKWVSDTLNDFKSMIPNFYTKDTTDVQEEYDVSFSGLGNFQRFTGTAIKDTMKEEYKTTYTFPEYMNSIDIRRKLWDDRRDKTVMNMAQEFALSYKRTLEEHAAELFNYAFTATGKYSSGDSTAGADTKALCASDHPSTADSAYAGDNLETTAFSPSAVETDRQRFMETTDGRGNKSRLRMDMILVPIPLEEDAWELINSKGKVDTADNNSNFHKGRYKLAVWEELTDPNNWFTMEQAAMKRALTWYTRVPYETWKKFVEDLQTITYGAYERHGWGYNGWRFLRGHNVA
jgi:hypothetical protein